MNARIIILLNLLCSVLASQNNVCNTIEAYLNKSINTNNCWYDPDLDLDTLGLINRYGYPMSVHSVTTADGYILKLVRIPHNGQNPERQRQPVFIQHGMLVNSDIWVSLGNRSLAFVLSNLGYDVWLGNTRGSTLSSEHVRYSINDNKFWDYTLDDLGHYDTSAVMDFIAAQTNQKIIYIGHSQGCTQSLIYAIDNKTLAERNVKAFILLAPAAYMENLPVLGLISSLARELFLLLWEAGLQRAGNGRKIEKEYITLICLQTPLQIRDCKILLQWFHGKDAGNQWSADLLPAIFTTILDRGSMLPGIHYLQLMDSKNFQAFDYGEKINVEKYGQKTPKIYDIREISIPVYLFYGKNDNLAYYKNVYRIYDDLRSPKKIIAVGGSEYAFNHANFYGSNRIEEELYSKLIPVIAEIEKLY